MSKALLSRRCQALLFVWLWMLSGCSGVPTTSPHAELLQEKLDPSAAPAAKELVRLTVNPAEPLSTRNFHQIQAALAALPAHSSQSWAIIHIAPGVYRERLFIQRDKVVLAGSGLASTIVQYPILRSAFLRSKAQETVPRGAALSADWGAAVVNIAGSDIALLDLTVHNSFALENPTHPDRFEHQFALRGFEKASRIITDRSMFATNGADTVSLWNKTDGLYYHRQSFFSGRVDLFCPRGSALVVDSDFVNHKATATLWHDGELDPAAKVVIVRSHFSGVSGFQLGRRHYDGQFFLVGNRFSDALADRPIYRVTYPAEPARNQPNRYGDRNWFYQNQGPAYAWLATTWPDQSAPTAITAEDLFHSKEPGALVFGARWQPERQLAQIRQWLNN